MDRLEKNIEKLNNQYKATACIGFILIVIKVKLKGLFISVIYMQIFNIIDFIFAAKYHRNALVDIDRFYI